MGAPRPPPSYDDVMREAALVRDQEDLTWAYAIWAMQAEKEFIDRYQIPTDEVRRYQGRGDLDKPNLKLVAAIRSTPKAVAEGSQLSRWWRKAGNACIDLALGIQKGMEITCKFIQDRLRTIRKLRSIRCSDTTWTTWVTRATAEWCLSTDWLKDMSWVAAKEATAIEIKFAKKRLTSWKQEVKHQVQNATSKAHA